MTRALSHCPKICDGNQLALSIRKNDDLKATLMIPTSALSPYAARV